MDWLFRKLGFNIKQETRQTVLNLSYWGGKTGCKDVLEWLSDKFKKDNLLLDGHVWLGVLEKKHYHITKWLGKQGIAPSKQALESIITSGNIDALNWIINNRLLVAKKKGLCFNIKWWEKNHEESNNVILVDHDLINVRTIINYRDMCGLAYDTGHLHILKWVSKNWTIQICEHMYCEAQKNKIDAIKWAHSEGLFPCKNGNCSFQIKICTEMAKHDNISSLKWLREIVGCQWNHFTCIWAVINNKMDTLKWALLEQKCPYDESVSMYAAYFGAKEMLDLLHENGYPISQQVYMEALKMNKEHIFSWAIEKQIPSDNINWAQCILKISQNDYEIIEKDTIFAKNLWYNLVRNKKTTIIDWLMERKCPVDDPGISSFVATSISFSFFKKFIDYGSGFTKKAIYNLVKLGNLGDLKWLKTIAKPEFWNDDKVCYKAARQGHLDIVKCSILEWNCKMCVNFTYKAAKGGHWNVFEWLLDNACPFDINSAHVAAFKGHAHFLQKMYQKELNIGLNKKNLLNTTIYSLASKQGHSKILAWIEALVSSSSHHIIYYSDNDDDIDDDDDDDSEVTHECDKGIISYSQPVIKETFEDSTEAESSRSDSDDDNFEIIDCRNYDIS